MSQDTPLIPASQVSAVHSPSRTKGRIQMLLLLLVCATPVLASYFTFYVIKPTGGKTNYGELIMPVVPVPTEYLMPVVQGKWTLLMAGPGANCDAEEDQCLKQLFLMRQIRASMGKEKARLQIVWVVTDAAPISEKIQQGYDKEIAGVTILNLPEKGPVRDQLEVWLKEANANGSALHLLDPNGARMMRYQVQENMPDFKKMRKDVEKLLKWNPIGKNG